MERVSRPLHGTSNQWHNTFCCTAPVRWGSPLQARLARTAKRLSRTIAGKENATLRYQPPSSGPRHPPESCGDMNADGKSRGRTPPASDIHPHTAFLGRLQKVPDENQTETMSDLPPCLPVDSGEIVSKSRFHQRLFAETQPSEGAEQPVHETEDHAMKVRDLIEMLSRVDPDREIIVQKDAEGNCFSPLADLWEGAYRPITRWNGEARLENPAGEPRDVKAVFLRPAN